MQVKPEHDEIGQRYFLSMVAGEIDARESEVVVRYSLLDTSTINFTSTFTPTALRGQGLARTVVEYALDDAESKDLQIKASCWYVEKILKERREAS